MLTIAFMLMLSQCPGGTCAVPPAAIPYTVAPVTVFTPFPATVRPSGATAPILPGLGPIYSTVQPRAFAQPVQLAPAPFVVTRRYYVGPLYYWNGAAWVPVQ